MSVVLRPWLLRSRRRAGLLTVLAVIAAVLAAVATTALALVLQAPTTELRAALHSLPVSARSVSIEASGDPAAQDRAFRRLVGRAFGDVPVRVDTSVTGDTTTWAVRADADRVTAAELGGLRHGFETLPDVAAEHFAEDGGTSTRNAAVVRDDTDVLLAAVSAVRSTAPVPLSIVVVAGAVTLFLAGRLLTGARAAEDRLFRARGASYGRLAGAAAAEGLVVGLVGAAVGGAAGVLLARAVGAGTAPTTVVVWAGIAGVTVLTVGAVLAASVADTRTADARTAGTRRADTGTAGAGSVGSGSADSPARSRTVRSGAVVVLLLVLAAVAVWRYRDAPAARSGDLLAVIAPAALLTALGVAGALVLSPVLRLTARASARVPGLVRPLGLRLAARDGPRLFVPAALLVLAVASGVVTATVDASTRSFLHDSGRVEFGAALRADIGGSLPLDGPSDLVPERVRGREAQDHGARPVLRLTGTPGDAAQSVATVQVVGLDAAALPTMLPVSSETFDADRAIRGLRSALPGVELGAGTASGRPRSLDIGVRTAVASATRTVLGPDGSTTVTVPVADADTRLRAVGWLVDEVGDIAPVTTSETALRAGAGTGVGAAEATLSAVLPSGGPWRLAALDVRLRGDADPSDVHVDVRSVTVGGTVVDLPDRRWSLATGAYDASGLRASDEARLGVAATTLGLAAQPGSTVGARLMPTTDRVVPVVASTATGASRGDTVTVNGTWSSFRGRVVGTVPTVPGTNGGPAYLADLPTLDQGVLAGSQRPQRIREVWASDGGARPLLTATLPRATVTAPSTGLEARFSRLVVLALLAGTVAAAFCAVLVLAATVAAVARDRRDETLGLLLSGVSAAQQARIRAIGPAVTGAFGLVVGALAGTAAAVLVGVAAVRASVPRAPTGLGVPLVADRWLVGAVTVVVALAVVVVTVVHAATVHGSALRAGREAR